LDLTNAMSIQVNGGFAFERYIGNDAGTAAYNCMLDGMPVAMDDPVTVGEDSGTTDVDVLGNDSFGSNGPGVGPIVITVGPDNGGTATVDDNGTPDNPTDDSIDYTPAADFSGTETFTYQICDLDGDCDDAVATVTVTPVNDAPIAMNDSYTTPEDTPV
ncbi:Ig-like domain-containing protein, partial [Phaeodactylibacter luteus]|uniref:Ig-like domain-containing protein n=1 Tax=Phaeodactylibacter luteus TaxID=1564516 RepID=UPI001B85E7BE